MAFAVVDLMQGSKEWVEWRRSGFGGSDAAKVMGHSEFGDQFTLYREKTSLETVSRFETFWMKRGRMLEPVARARFIEQTGIKVWPMCGRNTRYKFLNGSFDGVTADFKKFVEIKCPGPRKHAIAKSGNVPTEYWIQIQHLFAVLPEAEEAYYYSFYEGDTVLLIVHRDEAFIQQLLFQEQMLWDHIEKQAFPVGDAWEAAAKRWKMAKDLEAEAKELLGAAQEELVGMMGNNLKLTGSGVSVTRKLIPAGYDYMQFVVDKLKLDNSASSIAKRLMEETGLVMQETDLAVYAVEPSLKTTVRRNSSSNAVQGITQGPAIPQLVVATANESGDFDPFDL